MGVNIYIYLWRERGREGKVAYQPDPVEARALCIRYEIGEYSKISRNLINDETNVPSGGIICIVENDKEQTWKCPKGEFDWWQDKCTIRRHNFALWRMIRNKPANVLKHFVHEALPLKPQNQYRKGSQNICNHNHKWVNKKPALSHSQLMEKPHNFLSRQEHTTKDIQQGQWYTWTKWTNWTRNKNEEY